MRVRLVIRDGEEDVRPLSQGLRLRHKKSRDKYAGNKNSVSRFHFIASFEAEDVFHVVKAGLLAAGPNGGTQRAVGEGVAAGRLVR